MTLWFKPEAQHGTRSGQFCTCLGFTTIEHPCRPIVTNIVVIDNLCIFYYLTDNLCIFYYLTDNLSISLSSYSYPEKKEAWCEETYGPLLPLPTGVTCAEYPVIPENAVPSLQQTTKKQQKLSVKLRSRAFLFSLFHSLSFFFLVDCPSEEGVHSWSETSLGYNITLSEDAYSKRNMCFVVCQSISAFGLLFRGKNRTMSFQSHNYMAENLYTKGQHSNSYVPCNTVSARDRRRARTLRLFATKPHTDHVFLPACCMTN